MLQLLKSITGQVQEVNSAEVNGITSVSGELQDGSYICLPTFTGFLQDFSCAETVEFFPPQLNLGIKINVEMTTIEITY